MALVPSFEAFEAGWLRGDNQLVYVRLAADLDTPVSLMLKLAEARKDSFMLESVTGGEIRGRYSVVGMKPDLIWQCHGTKAAINRQARFDPAAFEEQPGHPLQGLRALLAESRITMPDDLPAIAAGLFGYLGYDMIRLVEALPELTVPVEPRERESRLTAERGLVDHGRLAVRKRSRLRHVVLAEGHAGIPHKADAT